MHLARPAIALDPRHFGRNLGRSAAAAVPASKTARDDVKLFATTFIGGFLFVSLLIA